MQRAMAKQAEAEREKRAKIIAAEGEALSVGKLAQAADVIARSPVALQLRNLQVLSEIAVEKNSTIVFPAQFFESMRSAVAFQQHEDAVRAAPAPDAVPAPAPDAVPAPAPAAVPAPAPNGTQRDGEMAVP
jgi:regulator of protease activity HflC (stomatin/prohibitin superfamily)